MTTLIHPSPAKDAAIAANTDRSRLTLEAGERWYVAMTLPHKERYARANLVNQGICAFLPLQRATIRHARQFRTVVQPLFPRYIFLILAVDRQRWRSVNGTFGVQYLICNGDAPLAAPPGIVESLVESADLDGMVNYKVDTLAPGDKVRLVSGPFAGALGILQKLNSAGRVQLLLDIMGSSSLRVSAPRQWIRAVS